MIEDDLIETNEKINDKKTTRVETSVNSKDSLNWIIYTYFLRQVKIYIT